MSVKSLPLDQRGVKTGGQSEAEQGCRQECEHGWMAHNTPVDMEKQGQRASTEKKTRRKRFYITMGIVTKLLNRNI